MHASSNDGNPMAKKCELAFALYIMGNSQRKVAKQVGVARATVERWAKRGAWTEQRQAAWDAKVEACAQEKRQRLIATGRSTAAKVWALFSEAIAQHEQFVRGRIPAQAVKYTIKDVCQLAAAATQFDNSNVPFDREHSGDGT